MNGQVKLTVELSRSTSETDYRWIPCVVDSYAMMVQAELTLRTCSDYLQFVMAKLHHRLQLRINQSWFN